MVPKLRKRIVPLSTGNVQGVSGANSAHTDCESNRAQRVATGDPGC